MRCHYWYAPLISRHPQPVDRPIDSRPGLALGSCTALISHFLKNSLGVDEAPEAETSPSAWTPRADEDVAPIYSKALAAAPRSPLSPLIPTILEEEDEDYPNHFTALRRRGKSAKFIAREYGVNKD